MSAVLKACFAYRSSVTLFRRCVCVNVNVKQFSQLIVSKQRLRCEKWSLQVLCNKNIQSRFLSVTALKLNASNILKEDATNKNNTTADTPSTTAVDSSSATNVTSNQIDLSTNANTNEIDLRDFIVPEPPSLPEYVEIPDNLLTSTDIGLTWYLPTGGIFNTLQFFHQYFPWWGSLILFTVVARIAIFPILIYSQKKTTNMANITPKLQEYQQRANEAKRSGNHLEFVKQINRIAHLMEDNNVSPKRMFFNNLLLPVSSACVFTGTFFTLRTMSNYPLETFKTEGLFWFQDLTTVDPTFGLQLLVGLSVYGVTKMGTEFGTQLMTSSWGPKLVQYGVPPLMLIFTWIFSIPNSVLVYMITSNIISMAQVFLINQESVRQKLKLPTRRIVRKKAPEPFSVKKSYDSMKDQFNEMREMRTINVDNRKQQKVIFEKAGIGPIQKTYKYDPTRIAKKN